jgi:hypothetical protein
MFGQLPPDPRVYVNHMLLVNPTTQGKNPWLCVAAIKKSDGWYLDLRYPDTKWDAPYGYFRTIKVLNPDLPMPIKSISGFERGVGGIEGTDF